MRQNQQRKQSRGLEPMHGPYGHVQFAPGLRTAADIIRSRQTAAATARPALRAEPTRTAGKVAA